MPPGFGFPIIVFNHHRIRRVCILLALYALAMGASIWLSYQLRFDFRVPDEFRTTIVRIMVTVVLVKLVSLLVFRQFDTLLSYFGLGDAQRLLLAMGSADFVFLVLRYFGGIARAPPRSTTLTDFVFSFFGLCMVRACLRLYRERFGPAALRRSKSAEARQRLGIVGAGSVGAALVREVISRPGLGLRAVAIFDDDPAKWSTQLHGVPVLGGIDKLAARHRDLALDKVIIAMPSASGMRLREIVNELNRLHLKCETVPSYEQLIKGQVHLSTIRPVEIQDLLGRDPVNLSTDRIRELVEGRTVLITGAGGSIGSELCRQVASHAPRRLLLVERCEVQIFQIEQELLGLGFPTELVPLVADILDGERMRDIFRRFRPQLVFHAAAHKHVPMMEHQPFEAFRNNAIGTMRMAELSVEFQVDRFVFISTDKAINPTSAMGATKRVAELCLQALQGRGPGRTKFMAVRFGNVLGSSGSVIPTFKRQIAEGGPVTITHPDVTRYFMTVREAVGLVLQSATQGHGGEIFVLDMGKSVKIIDLARQLIELSGLREGVDIEILVTGLRPGEKLFEEINLNTESLEPTGHPKIMCFVSKAPTWDAVRQGLDRLRDMAPDADPDRVKRAIQVLVPEYHPYLAVAAGEACAPATGVASQDELPARGALR
jgi:FlaA1/EpsC-like NDP-sugar epimerase